MVRRERMSTRGDADDDNSSLMLGVMLALTPSFVLLAFLVWREGIGVVEEDAKRAGRVARVSE
jgi:hypothetical protein